VETWQWAVAAAAIVIVLALVAWAFSRSRKRTTVLERFGPEYERAVEQHGDRRAAETDLLDRARRRERLDIRPLGEDERARYVQKWRVIQAQFVDQPTAAIGEADALLDQVMRDRGYPVDSFEEKAELISVDHPQVVENYRAARTVRTSNRTRAASTEELRQAVLQYRALFDDLLSEHHPADQYEERR
jgi:hypothetical protein